MTLADVIRIVTIFGLGGVTVLLAAVVTYLLLEWLDGRDR